VGIVRSWLRGVLGASGVTLLVPLGLLTAVLVAATVGGNGLGSVGQLIGGPEVPGARPGEPQPGERSLPPVPARRTGAAGAAGASTRRSSAGGGGETERRGSSNSGSGDTSSRSGGTTQTAPPPPPPPPAQTTPPPPPPPAPERNPIRRIGKAVQDLVRPLPIVGPTASDAVGTVIDLVAPPDGSNPVKKLLGGQ
jgi:hypothetical protein